MLPLLQKLHLHEVNPGACTGPDGWITDPQGSRLVSTNPTTGEPIAAVVQATPSTYAQVVQSAQTAFGAWRQLPAPKRGLVVRDLGIALREQAEPLGELVALEMGKIRAEGIGEVQEMVDICDFAVGLSRQLYGLSMHSERPAHRMYEQWHPLGPIGIITAFNFPVAVWSWNAAVAAVCGDTLVWKPSLQTPLTAIAVQHICNQVMADHGQPGVFHLVIGPNETIGEALIHDERLPLISFTGSIRTGRHMAQAVAGRLGKRSWSWAATTASSSPPTPISTWRRAPSSLARWAPRANAAPARAASSPRSLSSMTLRNGWPAPMRASPSAIRSNPASSWGH